MGHFDSQLILPMNFVMEKVAIFCLKSLILISCLILYVKQFPLKDCVFLSFRLWDMTSRSLIAKEKFDINVRSVAVSPDGGQIAIGHGDGSFRVLKGR